MTDKETQSKLSKFILSGVKGRCPRCGKGAIFDGFLALKPSCEKCDLDYSFADSGDGPAVFVMFLVGFIVIALVLWSEIKYSPPLWVHSIIWVPLTIILSLAALRAFKGVLIVLQYRNGAAEGVIDRKEDG